MSRTSKGTAAFFALLLLPMGISLGVDTQTSAGAQVHSSHPSQVAVIGDSLAWQSDASIEAALSEAGYQPKVSVNPGHALSSTWAQREVQTALKNPATRILVLETASNDSKVVGAGVAAPLSRYAELLDNLLQEARGRCVVIVNAKENVFWIYYSASDAILVNTVIADVTRVHSNVREVDWNSLALRHPSWFGPDLLHLAPGLPAVVTASTPPTAAQQSTADVAFADAITAGVESCGS